MPLIDLLLTIILISAFCVGWYHITRKGAIFGFCETFYLWLDAEIVQTGNKMKVEDLPKLTIFEYGIRRIVYFLSTPIIGCCKCFASFWGIIVYYALHGTLQWQVIICCIAASFTNVLFLKLSEYE